MRLAFEEYRQPKCYSIRERQEYGRECARSGFLVGISVAAVLVSIGIAVLLAL
jgi:hypothetical protein